MRPAATFEANIEVGPCGQLEAGPKKLVPDLAPVHVPYSRAGSSSESSSCMCHVLFLVHVKLTYKKVLTFPMSRILISEDLVRDGIDYYIDF